MPSSAAALRRGLIVTTALPWLAAPAAAQDAAPTLELDPIVVTASGFAQREAEAPATITSITAEEIEGEAYTDITDVLDDAPGISLETGGKLNAQTISIRGLSDDYVLFLVDGKPLGQTQEAFYNGFGSGQKTALLPPPSAIERIEVIRGPMSSLYGTQALGGVVNVITKPVADSWSGSVSSELTFPESGEEGEAQNGKFYVSGPIVDGRVGLSLYGSAYNRNADGRVGGAPDSERRSLGGTLSFALTEDQEVDLDLSTVQQDYDIPAEVSARGRPGTVSSDQVSYGVTHRLSWGAGAQTDTYITREELEIENGDLESSYDVTIANTKTYLQLGAHSLVFGAEYRDETTEHDPNRFGQSISTTLERWHYALFAEDEWRLTQDFAVTLGLRYDENENYGSEFTPRIYGVYNVSPSVTVKGGVSQGYKVPELKQADNGLAEPSGGPNNNWLDVGNSDLKPEKSTNYELGVVWDATQTIQAGLTAYYTEFEDKIDRDVLCPLDDVCTYNGLEYGRIDQYVNRDAAEIRGIEATLDFMVGPVEVATNYTFQDSEITSGEQEGEPLNNLPQHLANIQLDYQATDAWTLWGKAKYRSESIATGDDVRDQTPDYTTVDLGTKYQLADNVLAYGGVYNVFDEDIDQDEYARYIPGRRVTVGLSTSF